MPQIRCKADVSPADPETVRLSLTNEAAGTVTFVDLDGAATEQLIDALATARSRLSDPVPETLDPHPRFDTAVISVDPNYHLFARNNQPNGKAEIPLALRHAGLGWVLYLFSPDRAADLGKALVGRAQHNAASVGNQGSPN